MGIGASINRVLPQAQQATQQPSAPSSIGGKGSALSQAVQPSQSAFGTQQVQPMAGDQLQAQRDLLAAQSFQNMPQQPMQPYMQPFENRLASMQQQAQQLPQPAMQAGPFNPMLQSSQPVNQITGGFRDALQQRQQQMQQATRQDRIQNMLRRSRGLGGKGMR